jgi:hypothetical protein
LHQIQNLKEKAVKQFPKNRTWYRIREDRKRRARKRQIELTGTRPNPFEKYAKVQDNEKEIERGKVSQIIATKVGFSPRTYEGAKR